MLSSVVGFDLGYSSCYIAIARGGGVEIIDNEYSKRDNPTYVAYGPCTDGRKMALSAKTQISSNIKSTVMGFKPLIGRRFDDPWIQDDMRGMFNDITRNDDGTVGFKVQYEENTVVMTPEHCTTSLFVYLKGVAETKLGFPVNDCVVSVPLYYSDYQRRAMVFAAKAAGLNVLKLMNDTTATALAYGIYKQDLPAEKEKSKLVVFVDIGDNDTQVTAVGFNKGKLEVKKAIADPQLGGRHFGQRIVNYFKTEFGSKYKLDIDSRAKAVLRLSNECEKLKKTMSANSTHIPLNIECFMNDKDVSGKMNRAEFEGLSEDLFERLRTLLASLLVDAPFTVADIDSVEIVGGATRIPRAKAIIEEILLKPCSTTLNADECVARGCALQCAILSPAFKVREFAINDLVPAGIKLVWYDPNGTIGGDMEVFKNGHAFPFSKMLTFYRKENLILEASYISPLPHTQTVIGRFEIGPIKPAEDGQSVKVKVKVKVDIHGILTVESAHIVTRVQVPVEEEKKEEKKKEDKDSNKEEQMETDAANGVSNEKEAEETAEKIEKSDSEMKEEGVEVIDPAAQEKPKTKTKTIQTPLTVTTAKEGFSDKELLAATERENAMIATDRLIQDRQMAKNAVEEYVYSIRDKLYGKLEKFMKESEKEAYMAELTRTEDWLYDEGENCQKQVYIEKLAALRAPGDAAEVRWAETEARPGALNLLGHSIVRVRKAVDLIEQKDEKYDHLTDEDKSTLVAKMTEIDQVYNVYCTKLTGVDLTVDPPVSVAQINDKKKELEDKCNPILNKPKPKVEPPPAPADPPKEGSDAAPADTPMDESASSPAAPKTEETPADPTSMELD